MKRSLPFKTESSNRFVPEEAEAPQTSERFKARNFQESFRFAVAGLKYVASTQRNFRTQLLIALGVIGLGFFFQVQPLEWTALILTMNLMLIVECLNTAIEYTVDLYTQGQFSPQARIIKDISAGACLLTAGFAVITGSIIFIPYLLACLEPLFR